MGTYRQPGQRANFFNPAQDVLVGIESVERDVTDRLKTVRDFENAAAVRRADMLNALADTEGMDDMGAVDSLQASLMKQVDDLYKLDIASFEGDRSEYLRKQNETNNIVKNIPGLMGLIDAEAEAYKEVMNSGISSIKQVLRTNNPDYINFVDNASRGGDKISFRIQNGNIIAQYDGKDVFNGNAYIKAKKDGVDLVNYAGDYSKEIGEADKQAYQNLDNLVKVQSIQKQIDKGRTLNTQQIKDYTEAKAEYIKRLEEGVLVDALLNESTYQTWTNYGSDNNLEAWKNDKKQRDATKQAIIDYMVDQRFPRSGKYVEKEVEKEAFTPIQKKQLKRQKEQFEWKKYQNQVKRAETEKEIKDIVNFPLFRNLETRDKVFELEKAENSKAAAQLKAEAINEAIRQSGAKKMGFEIKQEGEDWVLVDSDGKTLTGVDTGVGLVDVLNSYTVYSNLDKATQSKIKPYVNDLMRQSAESIVADKEVKTEEKPTKVKTDERSKSL